MKVRIRIPIAGLIFWAGVISISVHYGGILGLGIALVVMGLISAL